MLAHRVMMAVASSGGASYVDDYVTPYGVWSAEKKLISTYSGPAIRVRRSSDNAEQNISFSGGLLDTAALLTFTGSNSGYVTKIYQQVAALSGADLVQATTTKQPRIVNAGVLETDYAWHDGTDDYLSAPLPAGGIASSAATLFMRGRIDTVMPDITGGVIDVGYTGGAYGFGIYYDPRTATGTPGVSFAMNGVGGNQARSFPNATRNATGATRKITARFALGAGAASDATLRHYLDGSDTGATWVATTTVSGTFGETGIYTGTFKVVPAAVCRIGLRSVVLVASDALAQRSNIEALL